MFHDRIIPFSMPTRFIHGFGSITRIPDECKRLGIAKAILVTDQGLVKAGLVQSVREILDRAKIPHVVFDRVEEDPCMNTVHAGEQLRRADGCNGVIILGGGSPLCAGKAIALLGTNGGKISDYQGVGKIKTAPLPVIAIPTTAGSGSEVSPTFLISNEENGTKMAISSELCFPPVAILDPNLLRSVPAKQAIWSGLDALTHAVESLWTNLGTPLTDAIALRSIQMMFRSLAPAAFTDDMAAKSEQLLASTMANVACGNAKLGLVHAFSFPFGNLHVPHGLACGLMLPFVMEFNLPSCKPKLAQMAVAIGERPDQGENALAYAALERVKQLYQEVNFPNKVTEKEIPRSKLDQVVKEAASASQMRFNIRQASEKDLAGIMERAFAGF
jgi:alcohol dehydrogenase